jgi:Uma2 family endonuclease
MIHAPTIHLTLEEYLTYDDGTENRYELVDGVLVAMGAESELNVLISSFLFAQFLQVAAYYLIRRGTEIAVPGSNADTRYPDLVVLTADAAVALEGKPRSIITADMPAPALVVEIVSPGAENRQRDYVTKLHEYALREIPEYWIIDPTEQVLTISTWQAGQYLLSAYRGDEKIHSPIFPQLQLTAKQVLQAGF